MGGEYYFFDKKNNMRMQLLRKAASFSAPIEDLKDIYVIFIRSILEQSCVVWHSSLTQSNINDLERVQKTAVKLILRNRYHNYEEGKKILGLESLEDRREHLSLLFAKNCLKNERTKNLFPENKNIHTMNTRKKEKYEVKRANTGKMKQSSIIYMQNHLNNNL